MSKDHKNPPKILIPEVRIQARVRELAAEISSDFADQELVAICILKGSFIFFSDMIRNIEVPLSCEFLGLSSYGNETVSSGEVKVTLDINEPLEGKNVIVFEDIVDSGLTLNYIMRSIGARGPKTLRTCSLLVKPKSLKAPVQIDYSGFEIGDEFVVGYGLDYQGKFRGLPYIGYFENEH
ncbi:MAG: hypoxanthine phosphoribosyltransferase [Bdellovibrionales bacterium]|nr:hypoxanthine phosphoribosyltransferase [Bdellovibrionales bacterium]